MKKHPGLEERRKVIRLRQEAMNRKILLFIIGICIVLLCLTGCGASYHLQQAKKHLLIAQSKGANINSDTVYIEKEVYIPGNEIVVNANETIDSTKFDSFIKSYDSLVKLESAVHWETESSAPLKEMRRQLSKAFTKDSTYYFKVDSITDVVITSKQGIISVKVDRKKTTIKSTQAVSVTQNIKSGRIPNWWIIVAVVILFLIAFVLIKKS